MENRSLFRRSGTGAPSGLGLLSRWWRGRKALALLTISFVLLVACAGPAAPAASNAPAGAPAEASPRAGELVGDFKDFQIVAYQGDKLLGGKEVNFSKVFEQGKPVVLNFWAGQCPPCRAEMPAFQKTTDDYQGKVIFVGIDVEPFTNLWDHDDAQALLTDLNIRYPAAYAVDAAPLRLYQVRGMPTTVFLSAQGQVVDQVLGTLSESKLRNHLEKLTASSA